MNCRSVILAALACLVATGAWAQSMKPGLWEVTTAAGSDPKITAAMEQMREQLAAMPPEQRKMVEAMMAKQGVAVGSGGGGMAIKMCVTKEMAARGDMPTRDQGGCKTTITDRSSSGFSFTSVCASPPSTSQGRVAFVSPDAYTVKVTTTGGGAPAGTTMDMAGKWLGDDCGSVKPPPAN